MPGSHRLSMEHPIQKPVLPGAGAMFFPGQTSITKLKSEAGCLLMNAASF